MNTDLSALSYEALLGIKSGVEHIYAAQVFVIVVSVVIGVCFLLYKCIKSFY